MPLLLSALTPALQAQLCSQPALPLAQAGPRLAAMALTPRGGNVLSDVDQMDRFKTYVRSLNEQFARWVVQQWETKADKFWSHGMVDYLRHAVIIKRDHPDAAAAVGAPLPAAHVACA